MEWPIYFKNQLMVGDLNSEAAMVTLWTKKEDVAKHLDKDSYAIVGQLYSKDEGLNALVRNCLANKRIRHIVITGDDRARAGEALLKLFENGIDEEGAVIGIEYAFVDKEIPRSAIEKFRKNVSVHDHRGVKDFSLLKEVVTSFEKKGSYGEPEVFPEPRIEEPQVFPSERSGFVIKEKNVGDAWPKILATVMRFGDVKKSQYDIQQKEVMNLMVTIEDEDPDEPVWKDYYQFTRKDLEDYIPTITTADYTQTGAEGSVEYTYGKRMRDFRGVDQIANMVEELKAHDFTRRAIACTWDVVADIRSDKAPCLNLVHCLVQGNKLYLTAFFRSNDMFGAWPLNAYGLRKLQKIIAEGVGVKMGSMTTISCSAHIYKNKWEKAKEIARVHAGKPRELGDPRGNFRIFLEEGRIKVLHLNPEGKRLDEFEGTNAAEIYRKMAREFRVHDQFHAFDLGAELQKAEIALENGLDYNQDQRLELKKEKKEIND